VTLQMERDLQEMGILPETLLEDLSEILYRSCSTPAKGYFSDPRDENTEEVPY
jgi:hypothetical protein